jgi:hypothetical protein
MYIEDFYFPSSIMPPVQGYFAQQGAPTDEEKRG